jgi:hypothetical protein
LEGSENVVCSGAERVRILKGVGDRSYTYGFGDPLFEGQCKGAAAEFQFTAPRIRRHSARASIIQHY